MAIPFAGHSQITDTVCMPMADAKRVLTRLERLKVDSSELQVRRADIVDLQEIMRSQSVTINNLHVQIGTFQQKEQNYLAQILVLHKEVRRQKRGKVFAIIGGLLTSGGLTYLFITK
jgi:hypothetical protein